MGVIIACRCDTGSQPSRRDLLHISVMYGVSSEMNCLRMYVGIGSRQLDFDAVVVMIFRTSSTSYDRKLSNVRPGGASSEKTGDPPVSRRMFSIFFGEVV